MVICCNKETINRDLLIEIESIKIHYENGKVTSRKVLKNGMKNIEENKNKNK